MKPPQDVIKKIKGLAKLKEIPYEDLKADFLAILKEDKDVSGMKEGEAKFRMAVGLLMKKNIVTRGKGSDFIIRIASWTKWRKAGDAKVADMYGVVYEFDTEGDEPVVIEEPKYAVITLWDEAIDQVQKLQPGKVYRTNFTMAKNQPDFGLLLSTNSTKYTPVEDSNIPTITKFFEEHIKPITDRNFNTANADLKLSENFTDEDGKEVDYTNGIDIRYFKGTVMTPYKGISKKDKQEYASYSVYDSVTVEEITVWVPVSQMKYGTGSDCYFIGSLMKGDDGSIFMNGQFVIPIAATPLILESKAVSANAQAEASLDGQPANVPEERDVESESVDPNASSANDVEF